MITNPLLWTLERAITSNIDVNCGLQCELQKPVEAADAQ